MKTPMTLSDSGLRFITAQEGVRLHVYKDAAGLDTIGVGHLITSYDPAQDWRTHGITAAQAQVLLARDAARYVNIVNACVTVPLTQTQFDALVSLTFNIGSGAFRKCTLLKYLNAGNYHDAAAQFLVWDKIHKDGVLVESAGLEARRLRESQLFTSAIATA